MGALFKNKMLGRLLVFCVLISMGLAALAALVLHILMLCGVVEDMAFLYWCAGGTFVLSLLASALCMLMVQRQVMRPLELLLSNTRSYAEQLKRNEDPSKAEFSETYFSSRHELAVFSDVLTMMASGIRKDTAAFGALAETCKRYEEEEAVSERITRSILPSVYPAFPERREFDIYASLGEKTAGGYGFYDYFMPDDGHICMTVGEASGRGMPSMLYAHMALSHIRSFARLGYAPHRIAVETNNLLSSNNSEGITVSAIIAVLDIKNGRMTYVNAGQPSILVKRAGEDFAFLEQKQSFVLAGMANVTFIQNRVDLMQGDLLLFMNTAAPEARNDRGIPYGEDSVKDCLNGSLGGTVALPELVRDIERSVSYFCKGAGGNMMALLMLRYFG